jgi:CubicO group peptidase (beta-lactamase class C family)
VLLALLVERGTGEPFHDHLHRRVLLPLGLEDTGGDARRPILLRRVAGYSHVPGQRGTHRNAAFIDMSLPTDGGSLYSTSSDLWRWNLALFGGQLLSPASLQKMTAPQVTTFAPGYAYGYGLFVRQENGRLRLANQGSKRSKVGAAWPLSAPHSRAPCSARRTNSYHLRR